MADSLVPRLSSCGPSVRTFLDLAVVTVAPATEPEPSVREWALGDGAILLTERGVLVALDHTAYQVWRLDRAGYQMPAIACQLARDLNMDLLEAEHVCLQTLERFQLTGCRRPSQ